MSAASHEPWVRYRNTGLYAVPSIHNRQVFAQLVFQACYQKRFDAIAVELPASYQGCGMVEAVLRYAPAPSMIIHPEVGWSGSVEVPVTDDPDCRETEVRRVRNGRCFPVTSCDSIVMALRCPDLLRGRWPSWNPEIAMVDAEHRPAERPGGTFRLRDDYLVTVDGLSAFIGRMRSQLQMARCAEVDDHRERVMGTRLRRLLDDGKEVLFVCGAAHWHSICDHLDSGARDTPEPLEAPADTRLIVAPIRSEIAWLLGWLDDIPRVLWELEQSCQRGSVVGYDKLRAVRSVVRAGLGESRAEGIPVSIRRLINLWRYTEALGSGAGRWIPQLDDCLVSAAEACVGKRFAEVLKGQALMFPAPLPPGAELARVTPSGDGRWVVSAEGEAFVIGLPKGEIQDGRRIPIPPPVELTEDERRTMKRGMASRTIRDWPEEVTLQMLMDVRARGLVERQRREERSRKFGGSIDFGIDCRRTIRARASGGASIYVRQRSAVVAQRPKTGVVVPPVAWIFDDHAPIVDRGGLAHLMPDGERICLIIHYATFQDRIASGAITRFRAAAYVDLGVSKGHLGKARFRQMSQKKEWEVGTAYLESIPVHNRCVVTPWMDRELQPFTGADQAIATAIKYAENEIILVARANLPISSRVSDYARAKKVHINRVSLGRFDPAQIERLRWMHWVPAPAGYNHQPFEWCARFVPPIR